MVFTLAFGISPLELARLQSGSLSREIFLRLVSVSGTEKLGIDDICRQHKLGHLLVLFF